ncbi:hypothetical protein D3C71_1405300 [compost metagenome]
MRVSCLIWIATSELSTAAATAIRLPDVKPAVPGRTITSTPMKPTTTAAQRRTRTFSPSHSTAAMVTNNGVEYDSETACASGRWPNAQNAHSIDPRPIALRTK